MALTRPAPSAGRHVTTRNPSGPEGGAAGAARCAERLEELLGDPRDRANPYGRSALWAAGYDHLPDPPAGLPDLSALPGGPPGVGRTWPAADELARALRPLFRRDLALAHAWSIRPLLSTPVPHPAAALLGPAALLASAGGVLRGVTRVVDGLSRHESGVRQWRPVLAAVFAELLACECLTAVALRSCSGPDGGAAAGVNGAPLAAVVGCLVPQLADELLADLELVLNECGLDGDTPERRTLAKVLRDRAFARIDRTAAVTAQARVVRGLNGADGLSPGDGTELAALFRLTEAAPALPPGSGGPHALAATLAAVAGRLTAAGEPGADESGADESGADESGVGRSGAAELARLGRRLVIEQRALRTACAATAVHDPADPAARALADRQALLVLATAVLGVWEAAAGTGPAAGAPLPFLGTTGWVLTALGRILRRLGPPQPGRASGVQPGVWEELARRAADGVDCDLYATRLTW